MSYPIEDHDRGLAHDLEVIRERMIGRRKAMALFATGSAVLVAGCGGGGSSSEASTGTVSATPTPTPTPTPTATATPTPTPTASGTCIADPTETNGPYPADGTNQSSGSTSNALLASGIVRSDIRASFLNGSINVAAGVPVTLTLTVVNANASCTPLIGYAVYIWHCDRDGDYSLYGSTAAESYLRGVQVTDANGQVTFTTIFPACYSGRYPHIHFEIFSSLANATSGRYAVLISQLAMPAAICNAVFASSSAGYTGSASRFAQVSISSDMVFGDNTSAQIAAMTPAFSGDVASGYTATATIGVAT